MSIESIEIRVKGQAAKVPSVCVEGRTVIVTGKRIKIAAVMDEEWVEGDTVSDPESFVSKLRGTALNADVFTFGQRVPNITPRYEYHLEWDNRAAIPITTFADWLEKRAEYDVRKAVKRAKRLGVVVKAATFDDAFVEGIRQIYNESPTRQDRDFWHYGKDFDAVKRENGTYCDRSEFIGAYYNDELIGFIKMVYVGTIASTLQVISQKKHFDKKPTNALIAKAVEICEQKGMSHLVYASYIYNDPKSPLTEFKRRNGFQQVLLPRYYIPLTAKGSIALRFNLHHQLTQHIPAPVLGFLRRVRGHWRGSAVRLVAPNP
jgi:hypothetical protein